MKERYNMLLQTGKFMINNMSEINNIDSDKDGIKKVIDLDYIGQRREEISFPFQRRRDIFQNTKNGL